VKSQVEIIEEIKKLKIISSKVNPPNTDNIRAQIEVLNNKIDDVEEYADSNWWNNSMRKFASYAADWLFDQKDEAPSLVWDEIFK